MANSFVNSIYNQDFNPGYFLQHHTILVVTVVVNAQADVMMEEVVNLH